MIVQLAMVMERFWKIPGYMLSFLVEFPIRGAQFIFDVTGKIPIVQKHIRALSDQKKLTVLETTEQYEKQHIWKKYEGEMSIVVGLWCLSILFSIPLCFMGLIHMLGEQNLPWLYVILFLPIFLFYYTLALIEWFGFSSLNCLPSRLLIWLGRQSMVILYGPAFIIFGCILFVNQSVWIPRIVQIYRPLVRLIASPLEALKDARVKCYHAQETYGFAFFVSCIFTIFFLSCIFFFIFVVLF
jgi:hypothetical protein